ncbi:DUF7935 family protein [Persicitalea jodogahamensis]|uniref:Uncharacterized protein n=1 Tax=Persicitalea jodogahamensis TaxID=402147 RepID=A0A8J3D5E7_9BACT|nr:hypothetical protein [Persicitalea jodogahamensis]GHB76624.1 hypothetical protein GCM10007390_33210 [Persicitalea jodogahamensis]
MALYSLLGIVAVALVVMFGLYLILTTLAEKIFEKQRWDIKSKNAEIVLPLRLQAYERICLFLERITPNQLLLRTAGSASNALEFQQILLREIREEFNHNLAQQVYMSNDAWEQVKKAVNEVQSLINQAALDVEAEAPANELGKRIFERVIQQETQPCTVALKIVKEEVQRVF